jgi:hypothetical protein
MSQGTTVILSPHFDDAVLSCWHVLASAEEVLVVNVFAGIPRTGTLGWWDRLAGATDSAAAVRARIEEDRQALALAGRAAVNLPFLDGQYDRSERAPREIAEALREAMPAGAQIYAPANLGDEHRDHIAVRTAALALHAEGAEVVLYADLPHATLSGWPQWVLDGSSCPGADRAGDRWTAQLETTGMPVERMMATTHRLSAEARAGKREAVLTYRSQVAPLQEAFGSSLQGRELLGFEVEWKLVP